MSSPSDDTGVQPEDEGQLSGTGDAASGATIVSGAGVDGTEGSLLAEKHIGDAEEHIGDAQPDLGLELARAQAERDAAVAALDKQGRRNRRARKVRRSVVARAGRRLLRLAAGHLCGHVDPLHGAQHQRLRAHRRTDRVRSGGHRGGEHRADERDFIP